MRLRCYSPGTRPGTTRRSLSRNGGSSAIRRIQGVPEAGYRANLAAIFSDLLGRLPADRLVAVTIPDYTVTPPGPTTATRRAGIVRNNAILTELATDRNLRNRDAESKPPE